MINCIIIDGDKTARKSIENIVNQVRHLNIIKTCGKLSDASEILLQQPVHILFLDVPQPEEDGVGFLEELKYGRPQIIITSGLKEIATYAYDIDAIDFLLKPVTTPRVVKALAKALKVETHNHHDIAHGETSIFLKMDHKFVKVNLKDIYLIEALADYIHVHTPLKRYTVHGTMKVMEDRLPVSEFIRVHKSYIVRIDHIVEVERDALTVEKKTIPVGMTYRRELMERLKII
jgi:two-component system, LytTR family, response regulator LytT